MESNGFARVKEILLAVADLSEAERAFYLDEACEGDPELRAEIESILQYQTDGSSAGISAAANSVRELIEGSSGIEKDAAPSPNAMHDPLVGQILAHYEVVEKIGEGGMGAVYRARDTKLGRDVALKVLPEDLARNSRRIERFQREARSVAALNHPNIVTIYSVEECSGVHFITMELVQGRPLAAMVQSGGLPLGVFFDIAVPLVDAICTAHEKGVIHRDLKPDNVMVGDDGSLKVLDFGLAKLRGRAAAGETTALSMETVTREGQILGTVPYMSPEQLQGRPVDHRTDIFSLGVVCYEMLTGRRPFVSESMADLISSILRDTPPPATILTPQLPPEIGWIISRCLEKDPGCRPQTSRELRDDLERVKREGTVTPKGPGPSIAILPFSDMSPERDQDYFCEGMAEEIINALCKVTQLRVTSRTSSFRFKGIANDSREIGRQLGVETLLEGSVRKAGSRLRITAQLIDVASDCHVWSERFDGEMMDVFALQDEIAEKIVDALQVKLSPGERDTVQAAPTTNVQAYDYYLRGRKCVYQHTRRSLELARHMFSRAIELDPRYARAYAGLADSYSYLHRIGGASRVSVEQALEASRKAVELDPHSAEAHASRGLALSLSGRHDDAEPMFEEAIRLDHNLFEAHFHYAYCCFRHGQSEKAVRLFEHASVVRPDDYQSPLLTGFIFEGMGRAEDARGPLQRALGLIEKHLNFDPQDVRALYFGAGALIRLGDRERCLEWTRRALAIDARDPNVLYNAACLYCLTGENETALENLERAVDVGFQDKDWISNDTDLDPIRDHPRFRQILERLDEAQG